MPAVTIADAVRISDSQDTKAVLQADSTTQYALIPRMTTTQRDAIASPATGALIWNTTTGQLEEYDAGWAGVGGSGSLPVTDTTALAKGSGDATKLWRVEVDGLTTGTTRVTTIPNYDGTMATHAGTETFTNKTIDADGTGNVITNIGSSEIKAEIITGLTEDTSPDVAADFVMTYDASATALKKSLLKNLLGRVLGGGTYTPGANITTNSTSMVDVDAANVTQTVTLKGGGIVICYFTADINKATAGNMFFRWTDGTNNTNEVGFRFLTSHDYSLTCIGIFNGLAAGSTTFKPQFRSSDANNVQIIANLPIAWQVMEIS